MMSAGSQQDQPCSSSTRSEEVRLLGGAFATAESNGFAAASALSRASGYEALIKMTTSCNLRCSYCYDRRGRERRPTVTKMSRKLAIRIIDELACLSTPAVTISCHGGEPLLNLSCIREMVQYIKTGGARGRRFRFCIITNGTIMSEEVAEFLKEYRFSVGISVDGCDAKHNQCRWSPARDMLPVIERNMDVLHARGIHPGFIAVLTRRNCRDMVRICGWLDRWQAPSFRLILPDLQGPRDPALYDLVPSEDEICRAYGDVAASLIEINRHRQPAQRLAELHLQAMARLILNGRRQGCCGQPCDAGRAKAVFDVDGNVYLCDNVPKQSEYCLGNLWSESLEDMLKASNPVLQAFSSRNTSRIAECMSCAWRFLCVGGCPGMSATFGGGLERPDPYCGVYKRLYAALLSYYRSGTLHWLLGDNRMFPYISRGYTPQGADTTSASDNNPQPRQPQRDHVTGSSQDQRSATVTHHSNKVQKP